MAIGKERVCPQTVGHEEDDPARWGDVSGRVSDVDGDDGGLEVDVEHREEEYEVHEDGENDRDCVFKHVSHGNTASWCAVSEKDYKYVRNNKMGCQELMIFELHEYSLSKTNRW